MQKMKLGGHRGLGCTDNDFYQSLRNTSSLPVENTLESLVQAYKDGANYTELDVVESADSVIFTIHNVVPKDHFFGADKPAELLNNMKFSDIQKYKTGRTNNGKITPFSETLNAIHDVDPHTLPWVLNIEIKGVQGSNQNYDRPEFLMNVAETVKKSRLPAERIIWSSFSLQNIIRMSHIFPQSHYGMLFAEEKPDKAAKPAYLDHRDDLHYQYLQFDAASTSAVQKAWDKEAHPKAKLGYVHPEILTVSKEQIDDMAKRGLGINAWALFEDIKAPGRLDLYRETYRYATSKNVDFTTITDYLPEMLALNI